MAWILTSVASLSAEPSVQRYFLELQDYRFLMVEERTSPRSAASASVFERPLLEEAGLKSFSSWTIDSPQQVRFQLQVYELIDSLGAFQLFTLWRDTSAASKLPGIRSLESATGSLYSPQAAIFWRGNFFFTVSPASGSLGEADFSSFVHRMTQAIPIENLLPVSVSHLPADGLQLASVRFYLGASSLSSDPEFPPPLLDEIGFSDRIEIAAGRYLPGDYPLYLVGYPTPKLADAYSIKLQDRLQAFFSARGIYMKRAGVLVCIFVGPEDQAVQILSKVQYAPSIKWLYEKESDKDLSATMTFFGLVTKAILGTGFLILMIIGAGLVVGLIRYEMLERFPLLSRRQEMIRLNLGKKQ